MWGVAYNPLLHNWPPCIPWPVIEEHRLAICHVIGDTEGREDDCGEDTKYVQEADAVIFLGLLRSLRRMFLALGGGRGGLSLAKF